MNNAFTDENVSPSPELIADALGSAADGWEKFLAALDGNGVDLTWRYYRDGGWLAKAAKGSRTICWLSVGAGEFAVTFYFADRLREQLALTTGIDAKLAAEIKSAPLVGKVFAVPFTIRNSLDVNRAIPVLAARLEMR